MPQKKRYFGTNTKMFKTVKETVSFLEKLDELTCDISRDDIELFVMPSYTTLSAAAKAVLGKGVRLGAQNMHCEDEGQFTGEISPIMLKEVGVETVCIGHSDRRHIFGETDEFLNKKVKAALKHDIIPLLCIGENKEQKDAGEADEVLSRQIINGLQGISSEDAIRVRIAYEPVWSIGVYGTPAPVSYASERHDNMRKTLTDIYGKEIADSIPLLYGGSVNPDNSKPLIEESNIDGLFIGRSAWVADGFSKIIHDIIG